MWESLEYARWQRWLWKLSFSNSIFFTPSFSISILLWMKVDEWIQVQFHQISFPIPSWLVSSCLLIFNIFGTGCCYYGWWLFSYWPFVWFLWSASFQFSIICCCWCVRRQVVFLSKPNTYIVGYVTCRQQYDFWAGDAPEFWACIAAKMVGFCDWLFSISLPRKLIIP